jgi:iron(III) transport system substrate-binding protein
MKMPGKNLVTAAVLALFAVLLGPWPCGAQSLTADGEEIAEGSLLVYSVNFEDMERALLDEFKKDTGIKSEVIRLSAGRLYERVMTENAGGQLKADIIDLTDLALIRKLITDGILTAHKVPSFDKLPATLKEASGAYYAMNRYPAILGYNTQVISRDQAPKSWADTLDPRLKGQVGITQIASGGSSWSVAMFQRKVVDPQFWQKQAALQPRIYPSYAPLSDDLARGEIGVGTVTVGLIRNLLKAGAPVFANFPAEGAPTVAVWCGVSAKAVHPNAARLFLNWITSKRGGTAITAVFADYASHPDVPPPSLAEYGLSLPPAEKLWIADQAEADALHDQWFTEWDEIYRTRRGK